MVKRWGWHEREISWLIKGTVRGVNQGESLIQSREIGENMFNSVTSHLRQLTESLLQWPNISEKSSRRKILRVGSCRIRSSLSILQHTPVSANTIVHQSTHRASTRASSPSTPTTACGVFASMICQRTSSAPARREIALHSRSDYRSVDNTRRSPRNSSCPCGTPFCTFCRQMPSLLSSSVGGPVFLRGTLHSRTTACSMAPVSTPVRSGYVC